MEVQVQTPVTTTSTSILLVEVLLLLSAFKFLEDLVEGIAFLGLSVGRLGVSVTGVGVEFALLVEVEEVVELVSVLVFGVSEMEGPDGIESVEFV